MSLLYILLTSLCLLAFTLSPAAYGLNPTLYHGFCASLMAYLLLRCVQTVKGGARR